MNMRALFIFILCFFPVFASAHSPRFVDVRQHDIVTVEESEVSQAFYGELKNFPHLFEITATGTLPLYVHILVPDIESGKTNVSGIVLKVLNRGVEEVTRMNANDAKWNTMYESFVGDTYREGPEFEKILTAGTYQIEVSSPDNLGKYVLVVGKKEEYSFLNYFGTLRDIYKIKVFFEKPFFAVLQSPIVLIPTIVLALIGFALYRKYNRKNKKKAGV